MAPIPWPVIAAWLRLCALWNPCDRDAPQWAADAAWCLNDRKGAVNRRRGWQGELF